MNKIIFITTSLSQPRVIKRIKSIYEAGFSVSVYGFDRGVYNCNSLPPEISVKALGTFKDGTDYLYKIKATKKAIEQILNEEGTDGVVFYTFGLIGAYFLYKKQVKYIYELSDVLYGYPKFDIFRPVLKHIERNIIRKSSLTVMTSEGFEKFLFKSKQHQILIQPNRLSPYYSLRNRPKGNHIDISHLRFAFIGAIRYPNTVLRFAKIVGKYFKSHEFHFYGESSMLQEFKDETSEYNNVFFHGKFKNPEDLEGIYNNVDIVVSAYHTDSVNERIAEPNKLYESIYFGKPIVVSKSTFLEKQVEKFSCGIAIDCYSDTQIENFIKSLTYTWITEISQHELQISSELLIDNSYALIERLKSI